jgi:hypothetical protein
MGEVLRVETAVNREEGPLACPEPPLVHEMEEKTGLSYGGAGKLETPGTG